MKTLQLEEAGPGFSSALLDVEAGNEVAVTCGKMKQTVAVIVPYEKWKMGQERKLGTLEGKMSVEFASDFAMTGEELINL